MVSSVTALFEEFFTPFSLDAGPLDEEEIARVRRIGRHIYGTNGTPPILAH
jgi:hypothetical protein